MKLLIRLLLTVTIGVAILWFARSPGFESLLSVLTSLVALLTLSTTAALPDGGSHSGGGADVGSVLFGAIAGLVGGALFGGIMGLTIADKPLVSLLTSAFFGGVAGWYSAEGVAPGMTAVKALGGIVGIVLGGIIGWELFATSASIVKWAVVWALILGLTGVWYAFREDAIFGT